ncbi:uncharacterized protein LOC144423970 [Styela clava]
MRECTPYIQNSPCPLTSLNDATIEIKTDIEKVQPTPVRTTSTSTLKQVLTTTAEREPATPTTSSATTTTATTTIPSCTKTIVLYNNTCEDKLPKFVCQAKDGSNNTTYFIIVLGSSSELKQITRVTSTHECKDFTFSYMKIANGNYTKFDRTNYTEDFITFPTSEVVHAIQLEHKNIENCTITVFGC